MGPERVKGMHRFSMTRIPVPHLKQSPTLSHAPAGLRTRLVTLTCPDPHCPGSSSASSRAAGGTVEGVPTPKSKCSLSGLPVAGFVNVPPYLPPIVSQRAPSQSCIAGADNPAKLPTVTSAAMEGHRVWSEFGLAGLISAWRAHVRWPEKMVIPGQRILFPANC